MSTSVQPSTTSVAANYTARQPEFRIGDARRIPLMTISAARCYLDRDATLGEDFVLQAIESGDLPWAWDLRGPTSRMIELRIWGPCVIKLRQAMDAEATPTIDTRSHADVFATLWKHSRPVLFSTEVYRVWNCGSDHVHDLIKAGLIRPTKQALFRNEATPLDRASVESFMAGRRYS